MGFEGWPRKTRRSVSPGHAQSRNLVGSRYFLVTAKQEEVAVAWTSECIGLCLGPTDGIVLHYARRKVQSSTCIPVGMHTEALAPPKPTGINSTNWTWFGSWQTSVPYRSSTFLRTRDSWISRSIAFSPHTIALSSMETAIPSTGFSPKRFRKKIFSSFLEIRGKRRDETRRIIANEYRSNRIS